MMKEIAIADAYGAGFEFCGIEKINKYNNLSNYMPHELYGFCGKYTDDTQMSIAIAEFILDEMPRSTESVLSKMLSCFKRDPREGYSKGLYHLLQNSNGVEELTKTIRGNSDRNGAAVRVMPIGFIPDKQEVIELARIQARATHNSESGMSSSCAVALAAYFGLHMCGEISELRAFLKSESLGFWNYDWKGPVSVNAMDTVSAAFSCLIKRRSLRELLVDCVGLGGDTDSVSAIAIGIASCFNEYDNDLPVALSDHLKEPVYGIPYLENIEKRLRLYTGAGV